MVKTISLINLLNTALLVSSLMSSITYIAVAGKINCSIYFSWSNILARSLVDSHVTNANTLQPQIILIFLNDSWVKYNCRGNYLRYLILRSAWCMIEIFLQPYTKIFPDISPFSRFDNSQLTRMMENYWDYDNDNNKIKTGFDNCEPQLLMVM